MVDAPTAMLYCGLCAARVEFWSQHHLIFCQRCLDLYAADCWAVYRWCTAKEVVPERYEARVTQILHGQVQLMVPA